MTFPRRLSGTIDPQIKNPFMKPESISSSINPQFGWSRRNFMQTTALAASALALAPTARAAEGDFPVVRTPVEKRKFRSQAVDAAIEEFQSKVGNKELAWLFGNCFPNTLDTTVDFQMLDGRPDTYVITGDIDAMWLRDSSAQVYPYLHFIKQDEPLKQLIAGVINRQTRCILKDPYANAFYKEDTKVGEWSTDLTDMQPGIHERKWEIDSLCYPIRLAHEYWKTCGDSAPWTPKVGTRRGRSDSSSSKCLRRPCARSSAWKSQKIPSDKPDSVVVASPVSFRARKSPGKSIR